MGNQLALPPATPVDALVATAAARWRQAEQDQEAGRWAQREAAALLHGKAGGYRRLATALGFKGKSLVARYGRTGHAFPSGKRVAGRSCRDHEEALRLAKKILGPETKPALEDCAEEALLWLADLDAYPTQKELLAAMEGGVSVDADEGPSEDAATGDATETWSAPQSESDRETPRTVAQIADALRRLPPVLDPEIPLLMDAFVASQVGAAEPETQDVAARLLLRALGDALRRHMAPRTSAATSATVVAVTTPLLPATAGAA